MFKQLTRSGATKFSDSELLILDQIAMLGGVRRMYLNDVFPLQFNCPEHGLDDQSLLQTLDRFEADGITIGETTRNYHGKPDRTVRITDSGAALWESERKPDWTRYVTESYRRSRPNSEKHRVVIRGHSPLVCRAFFDAGVQSGFLDYRGGRIGTGVGKCSLIYWRAPQNVYMLSAWIESHLPVADWGHFEMKRCWWRFADEIGKLWGWPAAEPDT